MTAKTDKREIRTPALLGRGHPFRQWKTWTIPGTRFTLTGYSRSNDKTFFHIPELKCSIDAGLCEGRQPDTIFLTHTHNDHVADIEFMAGKPSGVDIYAPTPAVPYIDRYIKSRRELNHVAAFDPALAGSVHLHPVSEGDTVALGKRGAYRVQVVECVHKVPCVGYCFSERKNRLKPEFATLKDDLVAAGRAAEFGALMAEKRKQGIAVNEEVFEPRFAFLGDTHASVFARHPWVLEYPVVITECTYLDDSQKERADRVGHTVWRDLEPVVRAHPDTTFVLIHFSLRHSDRQVVEFFEREMQKGGLDNVVVWAHRDSHLPEQHQSGS